jgi:cell division protein FtsB
MATLDDIKVDTSILASDTALKHLDERLRAKEASLSQLEATRTAHLRELQDLKLPDGRGRGGVGTKEFGMVLIVSSLILMVPGFALQIGQRTSRADALVLLLAGVGMLLLGVGLLAKAKSEAYSETRIRAERTTVITERSRDLTERIRSLEVQMADAAKEVEDIKSQKKALKSQIDTLTGQL